MLLEARVLLVGLGSIGQRHLQVIRSVMPNAQIMVLRHTPVFENAVLADFTTTSLNDVQEFRPQLAVISNPASLHAEVARPLLEMGCHLLIEKPLAASQMDGRAIEATAQATARIVQVGYNLRYLPSLNLFRDQIHMSRIGRVLSVRCEVGQSLVSWRAGVDYRQGVSARRALGGGVLLELSHEFDYLAWIFGRIDWVSAWFGRQSDLEIDVEDTAHLVLGFTGGEAPPPVASVSMDFIRHDTVRRCIAIGSEGSLAWDAIKGTVEVLLNGSSEWHLLHQSNPERDFTYMAQWLGFMSAAAHSRGCPDPLAADTEQALHVLDVVEAARKSCDQNGIRIGLPVRESHVR